MNTEATITALETSIAEFDTSIAQQRRDVRKLRSALRALKPSSTLLLKPSERQLELPIADAEVTAQKPRAKARAKKTPAAKQAAE